MAVLAEIAMHARCGLTRDENADMALLLRTVRVAVEISANVEDRAKTEKLIKELRKTQKLLRSSNTSATARFQKPPALPREGSAATH